MLKGLTAKVEISVLQSQLFLYVGLVLDLEGRCLCRGEDLDPVNVKLYRTCGDIGVYSALTSVADNTLCRKNVLSSCRESYVKNFLCGGIVKRQLYNARSVS